MRRAMFFSLDAIMALMIITVGMLFIANSYVSERPSSRQIYASTDIVGVLGELRVSEVNNSFVQGLIAGGTIQGSSVNNTLLEQAAQFWSENQTTLATDLLRNVTLQLFPEFTDYSILVGGDELLAVQTSQKVLIIPMKRLVSGIARDKPVHGIAARVFLGAVAGKETSQFIYFGGFAGQGNVTVYLDTIPSDANITGLEIEVAAGSSFDFYANNGSCGTLTPSVGNLTADRWDVTACAGSLIPGSGVKNNFTLEFLGGINDSFVGGGFVKVTYETDSLVEGVPNGIARYRFPAIQGLVNLYDGLVVPGTIVNMSGYLHYYVYNSSALGTSAILLIGSTTVYNVTNASADESIILTNATLGALLNYTQLSNGTVPLRFLIGNLSFGIVTFVANGTVHAALVTDVSGSMDWEMGSGSTGVRRNCTDANLGNSDTQRLSVAKCVDQEFVQLIFANGSMDSAIGLVSYDTATDNTLNLTNNVSLLNASIAAYTDLSSTCISCGVYNATVMLRKSFTQLNNATWRYSADYQSSSPPAGWQDLSFDDSSWGDGPAPLGFGNVVTTVINTSLYPQLWELWQDAPLPVDFTTGLNSTANTYGLVTSASKPLKNSNFSGPSINNWTQTGIVNLSSGGAVVKFSEDFETNTLGKWTEFGDLDWSVDTSPAYGSYSGHADDSDNPSYLNVTLNATSSINLSGETDCNLSYWWNMDSLDGGEYFTLDIFDGAWNNNVSFRSDAWDDNTWRQQRIDLDAAYGMVSDFLLRFVFKASATNDDLWLDNINITCVQAGLGSFGLTDYWYVDSSSGSAGSLKQNFSRGNGTLQSATLSFAHGTDDSLFDGTAGVFCNLTHPSGTVNVWSASWTSATNPAGAVTEVVNLTSYLNSSGFNYTLECGAAVTSGGGRTIVAFDDIVVTLNYSGNDGWDWKEGVYGNTSNEDVRFGDPSGLSNYTSTGRIEVSLGGQGNTLLQESGSWGLQFYVSQAMVDNVSSGANASLNLRYSTRDLDGDLEEGVWLKGRLALPNGTTIWLGSNLESDDATPEMWAETGSHDSGFNEASNKSFAQNLVSQLTQAGWYYLEMGGKIESTNIGAEGLLAAFDDVQLRITNSVGNLYFRNTFTVSSPTSLSNYRLFVSSDDSAEVYLNGQVVHNDTTGPHAARIWSVLNATLTASQFQGGDNVIAVKLRNNDKHEAKLDLKLIADTVSASKAMLIMSDGDANSCNGPDDGEMDQNGLSGSGCSDSQAENETVEFACWAHQAYGFSIYTVAFGPDADPVSLNRSACCDNCSNFYSGSNVSDLYAIYEQIASQILTGVVVQESQTLTPTGNVSTSALFSDSYLDVAYTYTPPSVFGTISLSVETDKFTSCSPAVSIDPNFDVVSARVTSYSGVHWTSRVDVNGINVYNLSEYSTNYTLMGDPFQLFVPPDLLVGGINDLFLDTADDPLNSTGCSLNNTLIYTALVNLSVPYGGIYSTAAGCNWTVEFEDNTTDVLAIPASASPVVTCNYTNANITYNGDDAYDAAAFALFSQLDFDDDGRLDVQFDQADLSVDSIQIDEVPSLWGPTTAEVRTWR